MNVIALKDKHEMRKALNLCIKHFGDICWKDSIDIAGENWKIYVTDTGQLRASFNTPEQAILILLLL